MLCKVLKLSNGDTIIGNITEESRSYIDVHRPVKILVQVKGETTFGIALVKWEMVSDFEYPARVFKHSIVSVTEPTEEFKENYLEIYHQYEKEEKTSETTKLEEDKEFGENITRIEDYLRQMMGSNTKNTFH